MALTTIEATVRVPGLHHWPDAHQQRAYLASPHRHLFWFTVELATGHDDREVEWHDLAEWVTRAVTLMADSIHNGLHDFGPRSCETLARQLAGQAAEAGLPVVRVSVSEDGEFTAHHRKAHPA